MIVKNLWAIIVLLVVLFIGLDGGQTIQRMENAAYDFGVQISRRTADLRVVVVAIDNKSLDHVGPWPWSRKRFAELINILSQGGPKLIVNTLNFSEIDNASDSSDVGDTLRYLKGINVEEQLSHALEKKSSLGQEVVSRFSKLRKILMAGLESLDGDQQLASAYQLAGNVVQSMELASADSHHPTDPAPFPEYLLDKDGKGTLHLPKFIAFGNRAASIKLPVLSLGQSAASIGFFAKEADFDGVVRRGQLVMEYAGVQFPSLALSAVAKSQNMPISQIALEENILKIGHISVAVDPDFRIHNSFYNNASGDSAFDTVSFADLLNGRIKPSIFYDKIVLIGVTSKSISPGISTPASTTTAPVKLLGHRISSMLNQENYLVPSWTSSFKIVLYLGIGFFLLLVLPNIGRRSAVLGAVFISVLLIQMQYQLMIRQGVWLPLMGPLLLFVIGASLTLFKLKISLLGQLSRSGREREESQRMLGLAFQGQGQLDLAFAKFKKCQIDSLLMDVLYDLVTSYEQGRRFESAIEVLQYMLAAQPDYLDIKERLETNKIALSQVDEQKEPISSPQSLISIDRYSLDEELGRGPIGTVFLGRDLHDNRLVAVKLIPMIEIFEASMMAEAVRYFVEILKKNKGLSHPNIGKVSHGGESYGRAFLVMEYISGQNLAFYVKKENLLPIPLVIQIVVKIAMALDYAQQQGVIHGGLKPSNILFDQQSREIKVVDFALYSLINMGGSRLISIRSQSQAKGMSYCLAPECASGSSVDARSDIFALGVIFYRLLTGEVPFDVDEQSYSDLDNDLIYDKPKPISAINRKLPPCLEEIVDTALQINPQKRFKRGAHLARALLNCVKSQVAGTAQKNM